MKYADFIASVLLVVGGLNWGLVGFFDFNLVTFIFSNAVVVKVVYGAVALSALWQVYGWYKSGCKSCCTK